MTDAAVGHESAIFIQSGQVEVWHGEGLTEHVLLRAGDYIHVPADTPHLPVNTGDQDMVCLVARTDPDEPEGVRLLDLPSWRESRLGPLPVGAGCTSRLARCRRASRRSAQSGTEIPVKPACGPAVRAPLTPAVMKPPHRRPSPGAPWRRLRNGADQGFGCRAHGELL